MRGKAAPVIDRLLLPRITPAYAGKSRTLYAEAKNYEDHPRLCGEKKRVVALSVWTRGSPPPMRGKVLLKVRLNEMDGITPAYAGKRDYIRQG